MAGYSTLDLRCKCFQRFKDFSVLYFSYGAANVQIVYRCYFNRGYIISYTVKDEAKYDYM